MGSLVVVAGERTYGGVEQKKREEGRGGTGWDVFHLDKDVSS